MASIRGPIPTLVWLDPRQAGLVRELAASLDVKVDAWGCPPGPRSGEALAGAPFDEAQRVTDLRQAIATLPIKAAILAATSVASSVAQGEAPVDDAELLRLCRSRGVTVLSLEPVPSSVIDAASAEPAQWAEHARFLTYFRRAPGLAGISELLESFGSARTLSVAFRCGTGQGSLGARLFDAMHLVHSIMGMPESVDASVVTHVAASGLRLAPGESLRGLNGDLTANLRFAGAKAASLSLSDRAGRWFRGVALIGENGCLRMDESGLERIDEFGRTIERSAPVQDAPPSTLFDPTTDPGALRALVEGARRALDPHAPKPEPVDLPQVLAMCEAAILSARTGQPESPATALRMAG